MPPTTPYELLDPNSDAAFIQKIRKKTKKTKILAPVLFMTTLILSFVIIGFLAMIKKLTNNDSWGNKNIITSSIVLGTTLGVSLGMTLYSLTHNFFQFFFFKKQNRTELLLIKYYDLHQQNQPQNPTTTYPFPTIPPK